MRTQKYLILLLISLILTLSNASAKKCTGKMINPVTDICWECIFPITIGSTPIVTGKKPDITNPSDPICICPGKIAGLPQVGLSIGLWEAVRLIDVTKAPFCFVNLGGMEIGAGLTNIGSGGDPEHDGSDDSSAVWHAHFYYYPIGFILQSMLDGLCLEVSTFDVAWITEVDPIWNDDQMSFLLNPEAILFGNLAAQAICAADCLAATFNTSLNPLFWCSGCQGGMYPMNGRIQHHKTSLQSSLLTTSRMLFRLHRQLQLPITSGQEALCQPIPAPIIKKSQYRTQMINPIPAPDTYFGCQPLGRSTIHYETMREIPITGEDFGYLIWRKRNCCLL
jgi:conjugal transfer pilus assembly protein TraU